MSEKIRGGDMQGLSPIRDRLLGFAINARTGLVGSARQVPSPNCDDRPPGCVPDLVVVHGISLPPGEFGGPHIDELFQNRLPAAAHPYFADVAGLRVSSHLLIRRDGELVQYVPLYRRAWHAGQSRYGRRTACNDFSVGIELEGTDDRPYQPVQYVRLAGLLTALMAAIPTLAGAPVVGHSDIAPGRKTDPGPAFSWSRLCHWLRVYGGRPLRVRTA
jgi:AmpD protein